MEAAAAEFVKDDRVELHIVLLGASVTMSCLQLVLVLLYWYALGVSSVAICPSSSQHRRFRSRFNGAGLNLSVAHILG
jgi:uncharacterized protein HemY